MAGIRIFEHAHFEGIEQYLSEGIANLTDNDGYRVPNDLQNDTLSSYILDPYTKVTFHEHIDRGGRPPLVDVNDSDSPKAVHFVGEDWNDIISSVSVEDIGRVPPVLLPPEEELTDPGIVGVIVYENLNWSRDSGGDPLSRLGRPRWQRFDVGDYVLPHEESGGGRFRRLGVRPSAIRSIRVGEGYGVDCFDDASLNGTVLTITRHTPALPEAWDQRVASLRVWKLPPSPSRVR